MAVAEQAATVTPEIGRVAQAPGHAVDLLLGGGESDVLAPAEDEEYQRRGHGEEPGERTPEEEVGRRDAGA